MYSTSCLSCSQFFTTSGTDSKVCVEKKHRLFQLFHLYLTIHLTHKNNGKIPKVMDLKSSHLSDPLEHLVQHVELIFCFLLVDLVDDLL